MQHAVKCSMCDYKCQQHKALAWHMKAKHGVHTDRCDLSSSEDEDVSKGEALPVAPPSGPVFPGMSTSPVSGRRNGAVDLSMPRDEPNNEDGVIEITPVSPGQSQRSPLSVQVSHRYHSCQSRSVIVPVSPGQS